jgi:hypothetical protein
MADRTAAPFSIARAMEEDEPDAQTATQAAVDKSMNEALFCSSVARVYGTADSQRVAILVTSAFSAWLRVREKYEGDGQGLKAAAKRLETFGFPSYMQESKKRKRAQNPSAPKAATEVLIYCIAVHVGMDVHDVRRDFLNTVAAYDGGACLDIGGDFGEAETVRNKVMEDLSPRSPRRRSEAIEIERIVEKLAQGQGLPVLLKSIEAFSRLLSTLVNFDKRRPPANSDMLQCCACSSFRPGCDAGRTCMALDVMLDCGEGDFAVKFERKFTL